MSRFNLVVAIVFVFVFMIFINVSYANELIVRGIGHVKDKKIDDQFNSASKISSRLWHDAQQQNHYNPQTGINQQTIFNGYAYRNRYDLVFELFP